jgi:hypothetical protein
MMTLAIVKQKQKLNVNLDMETMIMHPKNKEQLSALKAIAKALKIDFETEKSPYNPEFVKDILQAREDIKNGKGVKIAIEDLWK